MSNKTPRLRGLINAQNQRVGPKKGATTQEIPSRERRKSVMTGTIMLDTRCRG